MVDLFAQARFEVADTHPRRLRIHQVGQVIGAGGGFQRRADEGAQLPGSLVRLVAHRAHEALHVVGVALDLPGHVGLDDDPQAIAGTGVLQAAGGGAQAQVDRDRALERQRQAPGQARFEQDPRRVAETGDDHRLAGTYLHQASGGDGEQHQQRGDQQPAPGRRGLCAVIVIVIVIVIVMMLVVAVRVGVTEAQERSPHGADCPAADAGAADGRDEDGESRRPRPKLRRSMVGAPAPAMRWSMSSRLALPRPRPSWR